MKPIVSTFVLVTLWGAAPSAAEPDLIARFDSADDAVLSACDPSASYWEACDEAMVMLLPQTITTPSLLDAPPLPIQVRAVHNGRWIAFRLEWADATRDASVEVSHFSDQVAIGWPVDLDPEVSPFMGNPGGRMHIVHWKAIWQDDIDHGYQDVQVLYPNFWSDFYYMGDQELYPYPVARTVNSAAAQVGLMGIYAGNPVAQPTRPTPVEELMAEGFGTLTTQPRQNAVGRGVWSQNTWSVVIARPLVSEDAHDAPLTVGREAPTAFSLWDGALKNVGARKRFAPWITLQLESAP